MKKYYFIVISTLALLTCILTCQQVLADEVWTTAEYNVVYHQDRNNTAIWHYDKDGVIFIDGLAGVYTDRGSYSGYWVQDSSSVCCDTYREGADGRPTYHWGRFEIRFIDPDFPSRWQADISLCDRDPKFTWNGTPVTQ
ncbi:hypothetical protein BJP34_22050 [Moorena producens PAL-8-15-08-1]|uniref:Uncharacterized protein n=1 Tax=Moorena producens PAL-8-15-08-1 TaxID=1458985 RepID=A0A1D8TVS4_9CYAN|nr:hypothetical protein [Moorena producens]AOX01760.1 hypothetical protein BJP34_22050 [Moorena producens PAL-8-15-08-1]